MSQVGNSQDRLGGEFMVQDRDHMSESNTDSQATQGGARQTEQSQSDGRQQGSSDEQHAGQQGGGTRQRKSR